MIAEHIDTDEAKSYFEANFSHVYFILYDNFIQAENNLRQRGNLISFKSTVFVYINISFEMLLDIYEILEYLLIIVFLFVPYRTSVSSWWVMGIIISHHILAFTFCYLYSYSVPWLTTDHCKPKELKSYCFIQTLFHIVIFFV